MSDSDPLVSIMVWGVYKSYACEDDVDDVPLEDPSVSGGTGGVDPEPEPDALFVCCSCFSKEVGVFTWRARSSSPNGRRSTVPC